MDCVLRITQRELLWFCNQSLWLVKTFLGRIILWMGWQDWLGWLHGWLDCVFTTMASELVEESPSLEDESSSPLSMRSSLVVPFSTKSSSSSQGSSTLFTCYIVGDCVRYEAWAGYHQSLKWRWVAWNFPVAGSLWCEFLIPTFIASLWCMLSTWPTVNFRGSLSHGFGLSSVPDTKSGGSYFSGWKFVRINFIL